MDAISTKPVFYDAGLSGIVMKEIRIEENRFSYRWDAASILLCPGPGHTVWQTRPYQVKDAATSARDHVRMYCRTRGLFLQLLLFGGSWSLDRRPHSINKWTRHPVTMRIGFLQYVFPASQCWKVSSCIIRKQASCRPHRNHMLSQGCPSCRIVAKFCASSLKKCDTRIFAPRLRHGNFATCMRSPSSGGHQN